MRRDAAARRDALIEAAADCFGRSGYLVPLEEIAEQAGVGRGTLYRNFPDRMALALAVFAREIERLPEGLDSALPLDQTIAALATRGAKTVALFNRLALDMPLDSSNLTAFKALGSRLEELLRPTVERGHAAGTLRADAGAKDIVLAMRMLAGLLKPQPHGEEVDELIADALSILMTGLAPR